MPVARTQSPGEGSEQDHQQLEKSPYMTTKHIKMMCRCIFEAVA